MTHKTNTWENMRQRLNARPLLTELQEQSSWDWQWRTPYGEIDGVTIWRETSSICFYRDSKQSPLSGGAIHVSFTDFMNKGEPFHLTISIPWHVLIQLFDTVRYLHKDG